jgi:hypothetical protein
VPAGNKWLVIADQGNHMVRTMNLESNTVTTLAGTTARAPAVFFRDGSALNAVFNMPTSVSVDASGAVAVAGASVFVLLYQ